MHHQKRETEGEIRREIMKERRLRKMKGSGDKLEVKKQIGKHGERTGRRRGEKSYLSVSSRPSETNKRADRDSRDILSVSAFLYSKKEAEGERERYREREGDRVLAQVEGEMEFDRRENWFSGMRFRCDREGGERGGVSNTHRQYRPVNIHLLDHNNKMQRESERGRERTFTVTAICSNQISFIFK